MLFEQDGHRGLSCCKNSSCVWQTVSTFCKKLRT